MPIACRPAPRRETGRRLRSDSATATVRAARPSSLGLRGRTAFTLPGADRLRRSRAPTASSRTHAGSRRSVPHRCIVARSRSDVRAGFGEIAHYRRAPRPTGARSWPAVVTRRFASQRFAAAVHAELTAERLAHQLARSRWDCNAGDRVAPCRRTGRFAPAFSSRRCQARQRPRAGRDAPSLHLSRAMTFARRRTFAGESRTRRSARTSSSISGRDRTPTAGSPRQVSSDAAAHPPPRVPVLGSSWNRRRRDARQGRPAPSSAERGSPTSRHRSAVDDEFSSLRSGQSPSA